MPRRRNYLSTPPQPAERALADRILEFPALLNLRTRRLLSDVVVATGASINTARRAIAEARWRTRKYL